MTPTATDVAVIGGGIVGLMIARELIDSGRSITLIDPAPVSGASAVAAGMLADVDEYHFQEDALATLTVASRKLWEDVITHYGADALGFKRGILTVGTDRGDRQTLTRLRQAFHAIQAHPSGDTPLTVSQAQEREPQLSSHISCAYFSEHGAAIDPVALTAAILTELSAHPWFTLVKESAVTLTRADQDLAGSETWAPREQGTITGVMLKNGTRVNATETVIAHALAASTLGNLPGPLPLRPVYGDILRLAPGSPGELPRQTIRALVGGRSVYLVPRVDHLVLGATMREDGRPGISAEGIHQLLHDAHLIYPAIFNATILCQESGVRPGTPDNAPLLGRFRGLHGHAIPGVIAATGFYRHGVLLAPLAAQIVRHHIDMGPAASTEWDRFSPDRFHTAPHAETRKVQA